jgi:hypothetical protein
MVTTSELPIQRAAPDDHLDSETGDAGRVGAITSAGVLRGFRALRAADAGGVWKDVPATDGSGARGGLAAGRDPADDDLPGSLMNGGPASRSAVLLA